MIRNGLQTRRLHSYICTESLLAYIFSLLADMVLGTSLAAVCQVFTLVSMCTSIADPNWIDVSYSNSSQPGGGDKRVIYGVVFTLSASQNITDTGPLGGLNGWGMWLMYALVALCYATVLFSSSSLLVDFLGGASSRPGLLGMLYVITAAVMVAVLAVCVACMYVIRHNVQKVASGSAIATGVLSLVQPAVQISLADSFWISFMGLLFSFLAVIIHIAPSSPASDPGPQEDTEPLIIRA